MARKSFRVSLEKLEKAKRAFASTGYTHADLAIEVGLSTRQPIGRFLSGKPVDHNVFKEICFKLNLDWKEVADLPRNLGVEPEEKKQDTVQPLKQGKNSLDWNLAQQMRAWFEILGYGFEKHEVWEDSYFEWIINIPAWRRRERILVRGIQGEAKISDVVALRQAVTEQSTDQGCLVAVRRISRAARNEVKKEENQNLACYTFDELLDEQADFSPYINWLEAEVKRKGIDRMYVPLACSKEEFDPVTKEKIGESRYDESEGWIDGYIDRWLADPAKEHISVLGEFGTGKTWFVLHYAWITLQKYLQAKKQGVERPRLPLVIPLRDYAKAFNVESVLAAFFFNKHNIRLNSSVFDQLNRMGKLLLIFDGFDEMADRVDRQKMIDNFWELAKVVVSGSKAILTCRTEHFPAAQEGRALLNAELKASIANLTGDPPQFEVLKLEYFNDDQIKQVLSFRSEPTTVKQVMDNPQLLELARRPLMTELILEALPDIAAGKPVDMSRVYLYAVQHKMERDIKAERTFTSLADKLYFLCELSWEMLSTDQMSLNYRQFPDRLRRLFNHAVQEEKDLDHWRYDMLGQTMLIRNDDGDYSPAHRSLLEFFTAYKFAAELGMLTPDFTQLARLQSRLDKNVPPQNYNWSSYFQRKANKSGKIIPIPTLNKFTSESLTHLYTTIGKIPLTKAVFDLIMPMVDQGVDTTKETLINFIEATQGKTKEEVGYLGGNLATILITIDESSLKNKNLKSTVIINADLSNANLQNSILSESNFEDTNFTNADLRNCELHHSNLKGTVFEGANLENINLHNSNLSRSNLSQCNLFAANLEGCSLHEAKIASTLLENSNMSKVDLTNAQLEDSQFTSLAWSSDGKYLAVGASDGSVKILDTHTWKSIYTIQDKVTDITHVTFCSEAQTLLTADILGRTPITIWNFQNKLKLNSFHSPEYMTNNLYFSQLNKYVSSSHGKSGKLTIWDVSTGKMLVSFETQSGWCNSAIFCIDEETVLSTGYGGDIRLWNWKTQKVLSSFVVSNAKNIYSINLNKIQDKITSVATFGDLEYSKNSQVNVWSFPKFESTFSKNFTGYVQQSRLSPDGSKLAVVLVTPEKDTDQEPNSKLLTVVLYSLDKNCELIKLIEDYPYFTNRKSIYSTGNSILRENKSIGVSSVDIEFSPDGCYLACSGINQAVYIWDVTPDSSTFGQCLTVLESQMNCNGAKLSEAHGLDAVAPDGSKTLGEWLSDRGASL